MKFKELPFGIMCSAPKLEYVFCRVRSDWDDDLVFVLGEKYAHTCNIDELTDRSSRDDFEETEW